MAPTAAFAPRAGLAVSHVAPQVHYIKHTYIYTIGSVHFVRSPAPGVC